MSLELIWVLCFLSEAPVLPFFVPVFFRTHGWDHAAFLNQVHSTPWVLFPPWFPALFTIICLFLSWLNLSPLWETEAKSGSIVSLFYFLMFYTAEELLLFCLKLCEINLSFPLAVLRIPLLLSFFHIGPLSNFCTDLFSFLCLSV